MDKHKCLECGEEFLPNHKNHKICSESCAEIREKKQQKEYRIKNHKKSIAYGKSYRKENAEVLNEKAREGRKDKRKDEIARDRRRKKKAQIRIVKRNYRTKRRKEDKVFHQIDNLRMRLRTAIKIYSKKGKIVNSSEFLDIHLIIKSFEPLPKNLEKYVIHHIIPLVCFDLDCIKHLKLANSPENLILMEKRTHEKINHHKIKREVGKVPLDCNLKKLKIFPKKWMKELI